jgi:hypothetical protein
MKYLALLSLAALASAVPYGIDISSYQPTVDWTTVVDNGITFAYIKATEGTSKDSPSPTIGTPIMKHPCRLHLSFFQRSVHWRD